MTKKVSKKQIHNQLCVKTERSKPIAIEKEFFLTIYWVFSWTSEFRNDLRRVQLQFLQCCMFPSSHHSELTGLVFM